MIERLAGKVAAVQGGAVTIDVNGVGYGVEVTLSHLCDITMGQAVVLWVHTLPREDAIRLFGFRNLHERNAFRLLIATSGVGPKIALAILSAFSCTDLAGAIERGDVARLQKTPGVGQRMAEKIIVELRPKAHRLLPPAIEGATGDGATGLFADPRAAASGKIEDDVLSALENLGFRTKQIETVIKRAQRELGPKAGFTEIMRFMLRELGGSGASGNAGSDTTPIAGKAICIRP